MSNYILKYFISLICLISFYSCQKASEIVVENSTNEILEIKICRIEEVDTNYESRIKNIYHYKDFKQYEVINPMLMNSDSFIETKRDSNSTCVSFKIHPDQEMILAFGKEYQIFNDDNICEMIGSIEIKSNEKILFEAKKENVYKALKKHESFLGATTKYLLKISDE